MRQDRLVEKGRIYLDPTLRKEVDCTMRFTNANFSAVMLQKLK
jgi:hypothetical protein